MNIEIKNEMKLFERNIPEELSVLPQWVAWSGTVGRNGKIGKVPYSPRTGRLAKTNNEETWGTFEDTFDFTAAKALSGIGFVFSGHDDFVGIDLDNCIDPKTGSINDQAKEIIDRLDSFTEISPSGRGVHIIAKGKLPKGPRKSEHFEIYDDKRFFTVTGNIVDGTPNLVKDRAEEIQELYQDMFYQDKPRAQSSSARFELDDQVLIEMATHAENGEKFRRLWTGDFRDYPSQSEADLALCRMLAFWTNQNPRVIDRVFRQSGLYRPKWDQSHFANGKTYGQATIDKAVSISEDAYRQNSDSVNAETTQREFHLTDLGNAERLVFHFGNRIRYCHAWKTWIIWDGVRWVPDYTDKIRRLAKQVIRRIYSEAESMNDPNKRQSIAKHAMNSESEKRIRSMISLAQSEVPITPDELDQNKWLLTCLNGTVDLRSGNLLPHKKENFITKLAAINYDSDAICPSWIDFLDRIMDGNNKLISFLQRAIGYSLTGETSEQCIFILYGSGANGKSTFLQAVSSAMGDYSMSTPTETLLVKHRGAIPNDVARLKGARFVIASEAEAEQRLAESLIKQMTGGDTISARFLHQEWFDFDPTHKIFVGTNHKPVIKGTDNAIWRRIRLVPFEVTIPEAEMDKNLVNKLKSEASGILTWAVQGCLSWQKYGLGEPDEVKMATETYREEMDALADFLKDRCIGISEGKTPSKDLYSAYATWCEENGQKPVSSRAFGSGLREKGFKPIRFARVRGWAGIALV